MSNSPGAQQNPQYCMLAGALNVSFDGGATWTPISSGGGSTPTGTGFVHVTSGVQDGAAATLDATLTFTGGALAVTVPLTLTAPTTGLVQVLKLKTTDVSNGSPCITYYQNTTELAHLRADRLGILTICSQVTGGTVRIYGAQESNIQIEVGQSGIAFFGGALAAKQAIGVALTNGASGGTASTVTTFAGSVYATDAPIILGNLNQLAIKMNLIDAALKAFTLCSS